MRRRRCGSNTGWLTVAEAAQRAVVCELTIRRWIERGDLQACRPGHAYRIREDVLEEFLRRPAARRQAKVAKRYATFDQRAPLNAIREVAGLPPLPPLDPGERGRLQLQALADLERLKPQDAFEYPEGFALWPAQIQQEWLEGYHALYFPQDA